MRFTMKRTLALMLALMLALPTFVLADGANGEVTANELVLNDSLVQDGELVQDDELVLDDGLVLDGLSLELTQPEAPSGDLELGPQDPAEGGVGEQPDALEVGAPEEPPLELGDDAQDVEEEIPVAQPLMPPDYVLDMAQEGENDADPALAANDETTCEVSTWEELRTKLTGLEVTKITLKADCERDTNDRSDLLRDTAPPITLDLNGHTMGRKDLSVSTLDGYVIKLLGSMTINGSGTIKGGNNASGGGGIIISGSNGGNYPCKVVMNDGTITDNKASGSSGGGVDIESGSFTMTGGTIKDNSADGNGGGVYINDGPQDSGSFTMTGGAIKGNLADGNGGGVYVDGTFSVGETNKTSTIEISGNKSGQDDNNVFLPEGKLINVIGKLSEQSVIGVTTENKPDGNNGCIPITNSFSKDFLPDVSVFKSDDTKYAVGVMEENGGNITLGLGCEIEHTSLGANVVYDGKSYGITVNVTNPDSSKAEVRYKNESGQYVITENPTFKDAGSYTVEYEVSDKATGGEKSYYFPVKGKQTVTIKPKDVTLEWNAEASYTYNGQGQGPDAKIASGKVGQDDVSVTVKYKVKGADDSTLTEKKPVDVGEYVAVAELNGADKGNYSLTSNQTKEFTIKSASMTVSANGYKGEYDGTGHGITVSVTKPSTGYTVKYGTTAGTYDKSSLTYTNEGTYTVYYQVTAKNYVTVTGSATVEITAKSSDNLNITLSQTEYTYDGTAKKPTVTVTDKDTQKTVPAGEYSVAYTNNENAGTATVTLTDVAGGNYVVNGTRTFTIKSASMTVSAKDYKGEYDGKAHGITVSVTKPSTGYTVKYGTTKGTYDKSSLTYTNAGTYTVYYQVTAPNYVTATGSATVEITAKSSDSLTITLSQTEYTYDGTAKKPTVTVTDKNISQVVPAGEYSVAYTDNVNAGTATVTLTDVAGGNYVVNGTRTFTIKSTSMTVSVNGYKGEYDGTGHGITVSVTKPTTGYTVKYGTTAGTYDKSSLTYTNAGTYTVYYQVTAKNYVTVTGSATVEITARASDNLSITLSQTEYTYDGTAKKPTVTVTDKDTQKTVPAGEYSVAYTNNVNAGTATVTLTDVAGGNYVVNGTRTFTIKSASMTVSAKGYKGIYDGKAHGITVSVTKPSTGCTVKYGTTKGTYDKSSLTYTNAGVYTVYYQVTAKNYVAVTGSATVEITARASDNLSITLSQTEYTYDGTAKKPTVTVTDKDTQKTVPAGEYSVAYTNNVNAGTATVTLTDVAGGNYVVNGTRTFTIKSATMTVSAKGYKGIYDGKAHGITVTVTKPSTGYTVKYGTTKGMYDRSSLTYTNAGTYTVYYQVTAPNYVTATGSATVEITAKSSDNLSITLSQTEYTYDGTAKEPTVTVTDKETSQVVPEKEYKVAYSDNVNAGTAKVTLTDAVGGNYVVNGGKTFTINKAAMVVKAEGYKGEYDGKIHGITVTVTDPKSGYAVKYGTTEGTYGSDNPTYTDAGAYTVYYQVTAPNYVTVTGSATVKITAKSSGSLSITLSQTEYTYDGTAKKPAVTVTDKDTKQVVPASEYKVAYSDNVNAGTAKVTLTDVEGGNYVVKGDQTFTINKATMVVDADGYKGEYDGRTHGITVNVTDPKTGYTVKYGTVEGTYDSDSLTYTDVGVYTVYYQVTAKNYVTATGSATVEIITKALDNDNLDITLSQTEYTYDGTAKEPAVTVTDKDTKQVVPASEYSVAYSDNVTAGTAKVTLTDVEGGNYIVNGDQAFTINKAAMTIEAKDYKGVYDGKAHGIAVTVTDPKKGCTVKYGEKEGTYNRDSLTYTDAGVYTVYYQVTAKNYETVTGSATVEITAKELDNDRDGDGIEDADSNVIITLEPAEYTYDGKAKKPLVTVTDKDTGLEVPLWEFRLYFSNNVDVGTAKVTISDTEGGNYTVKGVKTFAIKGRPMTVAANGYEGKYDGEAHGITVNVLEPSTGYTVKYGEKEGTYDKDSLTYTDVGVYTVYYQVTAENYETVTGSAKVEITANEKASMKVVAEDYKGEYDREAHGIKVTVTEPKTGYTVKYSTVDGTYNEDSLTYTDVGVYTVYYQVTAENYETVTGSAKVEITARVPTDLTIDLSGKTYYYYAKARKPTVTVKDGDTVVPESEYRVTYKDNIHAGTATVKITSFTKGNYSFAEERHFTIKPRNVHLKYTKLTFTYDGRYHLPLAKAIGVYPADENKYTVLMTGSGKNVGRYIARTTGIDNPDYHMLDVGEETRVIFYINPRGGRGSGSSGSGNTRFVAEKKIGTGEIGTVTYNGKAQEPGFEVKCVFGESNGVASNTVLTVPASEYKVTYHNNVDAGKATVEVTDVPGGNFIVDFQTEFTIARRKATVSAKDQDVKTVGGVKTGVKAVKVKGLAKGHTLKSVKLDVDIKAGAKKGRIIPGKAKIVDAEGRDVTRNYKLDYAAGSLAVTPPKPDFTLLAKMKACGHRALEVTWTRVPGADGYELTFEAYSNELIFPREGYKSKEEKVVTVRGQNTWKFTGLKKNTAYKAVVRAWKNDGNKRTYIGKSSPVVCALTGDVRKHNTNAGSVRLSVSRLKLNVGKRAKVKASVKGVKSGKDVMRWEHALLRWYSDDANVATVNAKGEIRAVSAGECTVYALAANGKRGAVKVKVK